VTMLDRFTPAARQTVVQAGLAAAGDGGNGSTLGTEFLLLALADSGPLAGRPEGLGVSPASVREQIGGRAGRDDELLATLGIDAGQVRRRAFDAAGIRPDDPALWTLRRSRARPLRVTLHGPATQAQLNEGSRKVIEVATWLCRRGHRRLTDREDPLWGLLCDSSEAMRILLRLGVNLPELSADLVRWSAAHARWGCRREQSQYRV
jgi:Clp amino terminal domain, pathogenicity island component